MKTYKLNDYKYLENARRERGVSKKTLYHDVSLKKWRLSIQLDESAYWFLSVFFSETGAVNSFSLDYEGAHDSHYEFSDEIDIREHIYSDGDEDRFLDEIFSNYIDMNSGFDLKQKLIPFINSQFHY